MLAYTAQSLKAVALEAIIFCSWRNSFTKKRTDINHNCFKHDGDASDGIIEQEEVHCT